MTCQLKIFVTLFSGTVRPRQLKHGTHLNSGWMYHVYRNQAAVSYWSLYFFIFLFLQFSNIKYFRRTFLRNCEDLKLGTHVDNGWMYRVYRNQAAAAHSSLYFFIFLSNFQKLKKNCRHFLRNCEDYKVETWYTHGQWVGVSCIMESS